MLFNRLLRLVLFAGLLPIPALAQYGVQKDAIPNDPLELATGPVHLVDTQEGRATVLQLLQRARDNYHLGLSGKCYKLKLAFNSDSHGKTAYDGSWEFEEVAAPGIGDHWTAASASGYSTTRLDLRNRHYAEGALGDLPLVLHEARGVIRGSMATPDSVARSTIRTAIVNFRGVQLTCVLFGNPSKDPFPPAGRAWDEKEDCIEPKSNLLWIHSLVPERYALFDYSHARHFHGHVLPGKVTITEGTVPILDVRVIGIQKISRIDPNLFSPTPEMEANGPAVITAGIYKTARLAHPDRIEPGTVVHPVVIFALLKSTGELVEAHPLNPAEPKNAEAMACIKDFHLRSSTPPGASPEEHEAAIVEYFMNEP